MKNVWSFIVEVWKMKKFWDILDKILLIGSICLTVLMLIAIPAGASFSVPSIICCLYGYFNWFFLRKIK
jgi:hypothetical protein